MRLRRTDIRESAAPRARLVTEQKMLPQQKQTQESPSPPVPELATMTSTTCGGAATDSSPIRRLRRQLQGDTREADTERRKAVNPPRAERGQTNKKNGNALVWLEDDDKGCCRVGRAVRLRRIVGCARHTGASSALLSLARQFVILRGEIALIEVIADDESLKRHFGEVSRESRTAIYL